MKRIMTAALTLAMYCQTNAQIMENTLTQQQQMLSAIACLEAKGDIKNLEQALEDGLNALQRVLEAIKERGCERQTSISGKPVDNMLFPVGEINPYGRYFTGNSYLAPLAEGPGAPSNVTFEPGCRNNWHIHHNCIQTLICTGGYGWYQEWDKPARFLKPGDVVSIPEGVKHWHGAAADSWFQHIAYSVPTGEEPSNEWLEAVDTEHYETLPKTAN